MSPLEQIQAALVGALLLVIPPLTLLVVAKIRNMKADLDSAFAKIRAHEAEMGIKTVQGSSPKEQHVSRSGDPLGKATPSQNPQPLDQGQGA